MHSSYSIQRGTVREAASIRDTHTVTSVAIPAAISFALAFFKFPVPLSPSFAKEEPL